MAIDVKAELLIERSPGQVAEYAMDPANDPEWSGGISGATIGPPS